VNADDTARTGLNPDMTPDQLHRHEMRKRAHALSTLMQQVPAELPFTNWTIRDCPIEILAMYSSSRAGAADARSAMRRVARVLGDGWERTVRTHDSGSDRVSVVGEIDGIRCELWVLVDRCTCSCHAEETPC
jgi:hypothetical protein